MTEDRINIIIKEIQYWKENKLLPSHYCDFLLALYTQGDTTNLTDETSNNTNEITKLNVILITLNFFLVPITLFGLYFINYSFVQFIFSIIILSIASSYYLGSKRSNNMNVTYAFVIMLGILLVVSVYYIHYWFGTLIVTTLVAGLQCLGWIGLGIRTKTILLVVLGSIGLLGSLFYYIF